MIDPIGAAAAATATIGQSIQLIRKVTTTIDLYKNGNPSLEYLCNDLSSTAATIELVQTLEPLRTKGVLKALTNMHKHAQQLDKHINGVMDKSNTGSALRRMAHQFMSGPEDLESTNKMVAELTTLKATLILQIQVAHVGLSVEKDREGQNGATGTHVLDSHLLNYVNRIVEQRLGKGKGLKIAEVLQGKMPDEDGWIRLTKDEYECLILHPSGEDDGNSQQGTIRVSNNRTIGQALQINGFVDDSWAEFTHNITIEDNEADGQSIQINTPIKSETLDKFLATRIKTIEATAKSDQWPQPPPMPQQPMHQPTLPQPTFPQQLLSQQLLPQRTKRRVSQARLSRSSPYYVQPGVPQNSNPAGNGARRTIPVPVQVAKPKKQAPNVASGNSGG